MTEEEKLYNLDLKFTELRDKCFLNDKFDIFPNINKYGKQFLRINVYLPNEDITKTFSWTEEGYKKALQFIEKYKNN